ncbi:hypothetical protein JB92DRAFT_2826537 [Gautieria morchelliformis]|nr:hypothetical protein JB92DRAFT_2826537 [Gautieria morchelliformis]
MFMITTEFQGVPIRGAECTDFQGVLFLQWSVTRHRAEVPPGSPDRVYEFRRSGLHGQIAEAWVIQMASFEAVIELGIDRFSDGGVSVEDDLSVDVKKMFNKQLRFLDRLEWLAEGKPLDGNANASSDDTVKPYSAYRQQSKELYLYKEKPKMVGIVTNNWLVNDDIDAVDLYGKAVNPLEIHNIFSPCSWVVAQVTPTLWDITTQEGGTPHHTKAYQLVINCIQLALKPMDDVETDCLEGSSSSVFKHGCEDDVQRKESPPLAPAPKCMLLGAGTFSSSPSPSTKMPSFKKKVSKNFLSIC